MKVLIISEKPSLSRAIAPVARAHWPAAEISFVHAVPYGNITFTYPRGLRMQDYPTLSAPQNSILRWADWRCGPLVLDAQGALTPVAMGRELFTAADLIVYACDPDHTGAVAFDVLMAAVFGDDRLLDCPALRLSALDEASVRRAFATMQPFGESCARSHEYGLIKRYFDWNWNVNSLAILGDVQRRAGVQADAPPLSKYALQLLYAMRKLAPMGDGAITRMMQHWPGTGRYEYPQNERPFLGSCASRGQIVENLVTAGLLDRIPGESTRPLGEHENKPTVLTLSQRGLRLLELLHPDCEDPDLPFRLDAWCSSSGMAAKPGMDRYITTFFGKQKRFNTRNI